VKVHKQLKAKYSLDAEHYPESLREARDGGMCNSLDFYITNEVSVNRKESYLASYQEKAKTIHSLRGIATTSTR
jgi:hypothetical protein